VPGAIVVSGDTDDPVVARVVEIKKRGSGMCVRLKILPGEPAEYVEALAWHTRSQRSPSSRPDPAAAPLGEESVYASHSYGVLRGCVLMYLSENTGMWGVFGSRRIFPALWKLPNFCRYLSLALTPRF
jgi:hypothetical protein